MRKLISLAAAAGVAAAFATVASGAEPVPFPSPSVGPIFVAAHTLTTSGAAANYFAPGSSVVFTASAVDGKTKKLLVAKDVKYFYVSIPNQPNVKLKYDAKSGWTGTWSVPSTYTVGIVPFKVLVQSTAKRRGQFVQMPVSSAQLTISTSPPAVAGSSGAPSSNATKQDVSLYVDTVNGSRPTGAPPRQIGCTQTNAFKRGEQLVFRAWGADMADGSVLSSDNVDKAVASIPGQPDVALAWGAHGAAGAQVWFWASAWNIPKDYALGDTVLKVTFTTDSGKSAVVQIPVTIVP